MNVPVERNGKDPIRYIHIGYPKAGSTALQGGFYGEQRYLLHLGWGLRHSKEYWDDHGYIDKEVNLALEIDIRYRNSYSYDESKTRRVFEKYFNQAKNDTFIHGIGISNENLSFNWHGGIDTPAKARRLYGIFGPETQIIVVLRKQTSLIDSLYKESIRFGYSGSFSEYLKYIWQYQDRNFFLDFSYHNVIETYAALFGMERICVLFFEDFVEQQDLFLRQLSNCLRLPGEPKPIKTRFNQQLSPQALYVKRVLNGRYSHTLDRGVYHPCDTHRFVPYFLDEVDDSLEMEHYLDYHFRAGLCGIAETIPQKTQVPMLETNWQGKYAEQILSTYRDANRLLFKKISKAQFQKYGYLDLAV